MEFHVDHFDSLVAIRGAPGGNKAGVVHVQEVLPSDEAMQRVAQAVGFSETAFVLQDATDADKVHVRFFTPEGEVDLCGHATVAVFSAMPRNRHYKMVTKTAVLAVSTDDQGKVTMEQSLPKFQAVDSSFTHRVLDALGLSLQDTLVDVIPLTIVSTGLPDLFVGVKSKQALHELMKPNMESISQISKELETIGFHVFTLDVPHSASDEFTAECRNFAPLYGIDEEAATGTSSGALGTLLCRYVARFQGDGVHHFVFSQGVNMQSPSKIESIITMANNEVSHVAIAGIAAPCGSQVVKLA